MGNLRLATMLVLLACGTSSVEEEISSAGQAPSVVPVTGELVDHSIISSERGPGNKCVIEVQLVTEATKSQLKIMAEYLRDTICTQATPVFIGYYLPGMEVGSGAWATSHFRPELTIRIIGMTEAEVQSALDVSQDLGKVLGRWRSERTFSVVALYQDGGQYVSETRFKDGSSMTERLIPRSGSRFDIENNDFGEYYVLSESGDLEIHNRENLIETAKRLAR